MLNKSVYNAQSAPALCVIEEDVDHGTLYISQFVAVCPHSHLEKQSETAIPNIVQSQVKVTVATPPTHIEVCTLLYPLNNMCTIKYKTQSMRVSL